MKKITLIAVVLVLCVLAGCKKSSTTTTTTPSAVGFWTGTLNGDGYELLLRSGGTMRAYLASPDTLVADKYDGTWTEGSDSLRMYYALSGFERYAAGKLNSAKTSMLVSASGDTVTVTKH